MKSISSYLLVCVECNRLCRPETIGQKSRESKKQTEDVQSHQGDDLFVEHTNSSEAVDSLCRIITWEIINLKHLPLIY